MDSNPKNAKRTMNPSQVGCVGRTPPKAFVQQQTQQWAAATMAHQPMFQQVNQLMYQPVMQPQQGTMMQMPMQQFARSAGMQMPMQAQSMGMSIYFDSGVTRNFMNQGRFM